MSTVDSFDLRGISKSFGETQILDNINLSAKESQLMVLCGPPASGKSTVARIICGFERPDAGQVFIHGKDVTDVSPGNRGIGYVPQSFALFPHYSVGENISYPLRLQKTGRKKVAEQVDMICDMLNISDLFHKKVDQISGGQKQRVALARGLVKSCALYVLDDPLVGLDFKLREQLVLDLRLLQKKIKASFLYLTSDPLEPLMLGDDVSVLDAGSIHETSNPVQAYMQPHTLAMAKALGFPKMNIVSAEVNSLTGAVRCNLFSSPIQMTGGVPLEASVNLTVRPESINLQPVDGALMVDVEVKLVEDLGADSVIHVQTRAGMITVCHPSNEYKSGYRDNDRLRLWIHPRDIKIYIASTGQAADCSIGSPANE